ncbi:hypothetical protein Hanom_Chr06g00537081 [Helianthus anomalus]
MSRNVYPALQCAKGDLREIRRTLNGNELTHDEILPTPKNTNFIHILYTYEFGFANLSCFRTSQNANVNKNRDCGNAPTTKRKNQTRVLP